MSTDPTYVLSVDPAAIERCFLVSEILKQDYDEPYLEYGMIGLASQANVFRVLATPLLPGQEITAGSVYQPGRAVFQLRREIRILEKRLRQPLVPITFIHRHPGACGMSLTDERFLTGVFVDQVSTRVVLDEEREIESCDFECGCAEGTGLRRTGRADVTRGRLARVRYGVAFSLIINSDREYSIDAARKEWCPFCDASRVRLVPARLKTEPVGPLGKGQRSRLRRELEVEIAAKLDLNHQQMVKREG